MASAGKKKAKKSHGTKGAAGAKQVISDPLLGPLSRYDSDSLASEPKSIAFLGGHSCIFVLQDYKRDPRPEEFGAAIRNALNAMPAILTAAEPYVVQYCADALAQYDDEDRPVIALERPGAVWSHVQFGSKFVVRRRAEGDAEDGIYLSLTCNCDWDPEHGLQLVLRDGRAITKVGPYNGHVTTSDAANDRALAGVIYRRVRR